MNKKPNFGAIPPLVLEKLAKGEIKYSDFAVYAAIALYADPNGEAYPAMATLAKKTGMLRTSMTNCVTRLVSAKLVEIKGERGRGRRITYNLTEHPFK